ncbi:MAG TPA: nicotinate-nucleotide adenylyltransferase [Aggregatilineaceae bacterium]|nr:nicotinate-nucleotide adenylyltransferase [Aggregatilineaceae bacterium]
MSRPCLGIYGGTFDPPHLGHLILAETAADQLHLRQVLFIPAADPPHKGTPRTPAFHRLAMVERAIAGNPHFLLSRMDMDRPGPHYSVDMLRLLHLEYPNTDLVFLIGSDSLRDLPTWSRPTQLIELARLGVMRRPGAEVEVDQLEQQIPGIRERLLWIEAPHIEISASVIAARIADGKSVRYQVTDAVCAYIEEHELYRKGSHE